MVDDNVLWAKEYEYFNNQPRIPKRQNVHQQFLIISISLIQSACVLVSRTLYLQMVSPWHEDGDRRTEGKGQGILAATEVSLGWRGCLHILAEG